mmetsp:Transcript_4129/g.10203  ORF Transcript_4129/g.10203 Transcript_4129/m.10203 type:complete len:247 (+) Transcript_4129:2088-2828(+)
MNTAFGDGFESSSLTIPSVGARSNLKSNGKEVDTASKSFSKVANGPKDPHRKPESDNLIMACCTTSSFLIGREVGGVFGGGGGGLARLSDVPSSSFSSCRLVSGGSSSVGTKLVLKLRVNTPWSSGWGRMIKQPVGLGLSIAVASDLLQPTRNSQPPLLPPAPFLLPVATPVINFRLDHSCFPPISFKTQSGGYLIIVSCTSKSLFQLPMRKPVLTAQIASFSACPESGRPPPRCIHKHSSSCQLL